jgi:glucokinase
MRAALAVGVDVGGTNLAVGLVERGGRTVKEARAQTPDSGPFGIIDAVIDLVEEVTEGIHPSEIAGVGCGLPAQVDFARQSVEFCTNLPLAGVDVRSLVMSRLDMVVTLDNDGNAAAIGEFRFGAAKDVADFLMVTVGTGVGGGVFVRGEPYRGHRGLAGELGHMVVDLDGPPCPCGGTGHLEALVAGPAITRSAREAAETYKGASLKDYSGGDVEAITPETVLAAAQDGDDVAIKILGDAGHTLGRALVGVVNLLNPRQIVVGGGLGEASRYMIQRAAEAIAGEAMAGRRDLKVVPAELGSDAGILGAAALAFDEHDARLGLHR